MCVGVCYFVYVCFFSVAIEIFSMNKVDYKSACHVLFDINVKKTYQFRTRYTPNSTTSILLKTRLSTR